MSEADPWRLPSPPLAGWFTEQQRLVGEAWDNIHLCTGEEGTWKSLWMRKCARRVDPKFTVARIHFKQDAFLRDASRLEAGRAIVLDEFKGHKRQAMHGFRMKFLDWVKDNREKSLHIWIGYPHVSQFEGDLLFNRIRWWEHKPSRPIVEIRRRRSHLAFAQDGIPLNPTNFPPYGRYAMTGKNDPFRAEYQAKKAAHMLESALPDEDGAAPMERPLLDSAAVAWAKADMAQRALGRV